MRDADALHQTERHDHLSGVWGDDRRLAQEETAPVSDREDRIKAILDEIAKQTAEVDFVIFEAPQALDIAIFLTELQLLMEFEDQQ